MKSSIKSLDKGSVKEQVVSFVNQFLQNVANAKENTKENATEKKMDIKLNKKLAFKLAQALVKQFEGLRFRAYKCSAGVWTIGWGNTSFLKNKTSPENYTITLAQAQELFEMDLSHFFEFICQRLEKICSERQIAALTSFAFNVGLGAFSRSTLLKTILNNSNDKQKISEQFAKWNKIGKQVSLGLTRRRKLECEYYFSKNVIPAQAGI